MFLRLWKKECMQNAKSIVFILFIICMALFYFSQMGQITYAPEPKEGQESYIEYGSAISTEPADIMKNALSSLMSEYFFGSFTTYPVGFSKNVELNKSEMEQVKDTIEKMTGQGIEELKQKMEEFYSSQQIVMRPMEILPADDVDYEGFLKEMDDIDTMLGGGSDYSMEKLKKGVSVPADYESARKAYDHMVKDDKLSGGIARLFCDYMGIILGLIPVFVVVTRGLRDRRAGMNELIYTREVSSAAVVLSRYAAMVCMMMAVVLILSCFPLAECIAYGKQNGLAVDYLAFIRYSFIWLFPEILVVSALGMFLTELTDSAAAVFVQAAWWFASVFMTVGGIGGGDYGFDLIIRHNTDMNYEGYINGAGQILLNRSIYTIAAVVLTALTVVVYNEKRKGRLMIREKIFGNRKRKCKA